MSATANEQKHTIGAIAEELDAHRKRVLESHEHLTLTGLYNVLERLKAGVRPEDLDARERRIFDDGLVLIMKELHERLDAAVADAYGWPAATAARPSPIAGPRDFPRQTGLRLAYSSRLREKVARRAG